MDSKLGGIAYSLHSLHSGRVNLKPIFFRISYVLLVFVICPDYTDKERVKIVSCISLFQPTKRAQLTIASDPIQPYLYILT